MGTRALPASGWLVRDSDAPVQLARKRGLLDGDHHHDVVAAALPGSDTAAREAAELVADACGAPLNRVDRPPLEAAAVLVQEDLCVLDRSDGRWLLVAGVVAFPSMWRLQDKLGLPVAAIHDPVPFYASELAERVDRFLDRLRSDSSVWRRNWFV